MIIPAGIDRLVEILRSQILKKKYLTNFLQTKIEKDYKMIDIYFKDLSEAIQKRLLEETGLNTPEQANWDVIPIFCYYVDDNTECDCDNCDCKERT